MAITPGERTLYAYFANLPRARQAAAALEDKGFTLPVVDRTTGWDMGTALSQSTMYPEGTGEMLAEVNFDRSYVLILPTTDDQVNKAIRIIREHGGIV